MRVMRSANAPCPYEVCDGSGFVFDREAFTTSECRCRPQRLAAAKASRLSAVIPRRYADLSFDRPPVTQIDPGVVSEVRRYADTIGDQLDAGRGLWLMGDVGTGKTTLAMLVSRAARMAGRSVAIYSLPRLLSELRKTFDESADLSYLQLMDSLIEVDLLHIDDVGAEKTSDWVLEQLYAIVNGRYEDERAVVLTTNLDPPALEEQIGVRTVSRLLEMCGDPLPLFGEDQRKHNLDGGPAAPDAWEPPATGGYGELGSAALRWPA
jgi:DNA replication protein DnaC